MTGSYQSPEKEAQQRPPLGVQGPHRTPQRLCRVEAAPHGGADSAERGQRGREKERGRGIKAARLSPAPGGRMPLK